MSNENQPKSLVLKTIDNPHDANEKLVTWGDHYKLIDLQGVGSRLELPGKPSILKAKALLKQRDVIVFYDRNGGGRAFSDWWKSQLDQMNEDQPWLFLSGRQWNEVSIEGSDRIGNNEANIGKRGRGKHKTKLDSIRNHIVRMGRQEKTEHFFESFYEIKKEIDKGTLKRINLIFYEPSALNDQADHLIRAIRMARDSFPDLSMHVLIVNSSEDLFLNTIENSPYLPIARCYRLAFLDKEDIRELSIAHFGTNDPIDMNFVLDIQKKVGGHPFLTQTLIRRVKYLLDERKLRGQVSIHQVDYCFRQMKTSPPDIVKLWMSNMKILLNGKKELVPTFRAYVEGMTLGRGRFPPPINERPLMIGGWVGLLPGQHRWGILSDYHAYMGIKVLSELEVFV